MDELNTHSTFWSHQDYPFTQFAHNLLINESVQAALLHLQHHSGFNINLILYALWFAKSRGGKLTKRNLNLLQITIYSWHQRILVELKYTHALLANDLTDIAINIKRQLQEEIERANLIEQRMLVESRPKIKALKRSTKQQLDDASASLINYCELKNDLLIQEDKTALIKLLCHVFDELTESDIHNQINTIFDRLKAPELNPVQLMWEGF